jgi:hypothetical protein
MKSVLLRSIIANNCEIRLSVAADGSGFADGKHFVIPNERSFPANFMVMFPES